MLRSIRTTSGWSARRELDRLARSRPRRRPEIARPRSSSARSPARNAGWSSATRMRIGSSHHAVHRPARRRSAGERQPGDDPRPAAGPCLEPTLAAELRRPLAHRLQPDARSRRARRQATAVVVATSIGRAGRVPPRAGRVHSRAPACRTALVIASTRSGRRRPRRPRAARAAGPLGPDVDRRRPGRARRRPAACCRAPRRGPSSSSAGGRSPSTSRLTSARARAISACSAASCRAACRRVVGRGASRPPRRASRSPRAPARARRGGRAGAGAAPPRAPPRGARAMPRSSLSSSACAAAPIWRARSSSRREVGCGQRVRLAARREQQATDRHRAEGKLTLDRRVAVDARSAASRPALRSRARGRRRAGAARRRRHRRRPRGIDAGSKASSSRSPRRRIARNGSSRSP